MTGSPVVEHAHATGSPVIEHAHIRQVALW